MSKTPKTTSDAGAGLGQMDCSPSSLDGYRAAEICVKELLDYATTRTPKRYPRKKLSQYWQGYHDGLLAAHCQHAMGAFPSHNATSIRKALSVANTFMTEMQHKQVNAND